MRSGTDQEDGPPTHEPLKSALDRPGPDLRTLEIAEQRDRPAGILGRLPHRPGGGPMRLRVAVREVQPRDVHPGLDHRPHDLRRRARRPDGANDASPAEHVHW